VRVKFIDDVNAVKMDGKLSIFGDQIAKISETDWHLNKTNHFGHLSPKVVYLQNKEQNMAQFC
jgi:hypothetical protein